MNQARKTSACERGSRAALLLVSAALQACGTNPTLPNYARLNRSNAVDFVCLQDSAIVPLDTCRGGTGTLQLYAFVSQSARGEIATIDVLQRQLLDSRPDIPGYTFVPVGEGPVAIVVPPKHPEYTYVANFGSRDVYVFDTRSLVPPARSSEPLQKFVLSFDGPDGTVPAAPTQMVLDPNNDNEDALLVGVPDLGRIFRLPILRQCAADQPNCHNGLIDETSVRSVALQGSAMRTPANVPPASGDTRYEALCDYTRPVPPPAAPIQLRAADLMAAPHPRGLAVDAFCPVDATDCKRRLLVADDALPLIHVLDLDAFGATDPSGALLDPIAVGVPTQELAVTPRVPVTLDSQQETQYIYAIDATDGSVLVIEGSQVLNVNAFPNPRADRIELPNTDGRGAPTATTLAVLTPGFDPTKPSWDQYLSRSDDVTLLQDGLPHELCPEPDNTVQSASMLRGVFVAVALSDGKVRLVDVHDLTLRSPDGWPACRACPATPLMPVPLLARHHLRLTNPEEVPEPTLTPTTDSLAFISTGQQFPIRVDGTSGSTDAPNMSCMACGAGLPQVFPPPPDASSSTDATDTPATCAAETPALVCALSDPWSRLEEYWSATYEGTLPGAVGGAAQLAAPGEPGNRSGAPELLTNIDLCDVGVLGDEDVATAYANDVCEPDVALLEAHGDQVTINSPLIDSVSPACAAAHQALIDDPQLTISFPIRRAYRDRLIIASQTILPPNAPEALMGIRGYEDVRRCVGSVPLAFAVRARDAFTVEGSQSGFQHSVKANAAGRCAIDATTMPIRDGRARRGCTFDNGAISFHMQRAAPGEDDPTPGVQWQLHLLSPSPRLFFDGNNLGLSQARVLAVQMRYLAVTRSLYLIDIHERGLVPIPAGDTAFPEAIDSTLTVQ